MRNIIKKILKEEISENIINKMIVKLDNIFSYENGRIYHKKNYLGFISEIDRYFHVISKIVEEVYGFSNKDSFDITYKFIAYFLEKNGYPYTPGQRIKLIYMSDPYTSLSDGATGTFKGYDGMGNLLMKWDNGSNLSLIPIEDKWELL
jgi:hypothetical protein